MLSNQPPPDLTDPDSRIIAALVVTHNRLDKLRVTVTRLLAEPLDHIVIYDNASDDGTGDYLAGLDDARLVVVRSAANLGGAGGFANGLREIVSRFDPDWAVVMDDDGRPLPGAIAEFRQSVQPGWHALGAAVLTPDGQICEMNRPYRNPFWHLPEFLRTLSGQGRRGFHLDDAAYRPADKTPDDPAAHARAPLREIDMTSFVGLFLSRAALARAGYPDPRLFIYGDDQLYTLRLRRKGLRIGFMPQVRFEHDTGSIQAGGQLVLRPMWKVYYMYRNALLAYRVAAGIWFWPLLPVLVLKWLRQASRYPGQEARYRRLLWLALADGLKKSLGRAHADVVALAD